MISPENISMQCPEVPDGTIFLPISRDRSLKDIDSQIFQLYVGGRGPLGDLPLQEKIEMHRKLSAEKVSILGATAFTTPE